MLEKAEQQWLTQRFRTTHFMNCAVLYSIFHALTLYSSKKYPMLSKFYILKLHCKSVSFDSVIAFVNEILLAELEFLTTLKLYLLKW